MNRYLKSFSLASLAGMAAVAGSANAALDVSAVVTSLTTDGTAAITSIGVAALTVLGIVAVFKYVKRAF